MGIAESLALYRFLSFGTVMFLFGAFAFLASLVPEPLAGVVSALLRPARTAAIVVALVATAALLPLTVASVGDGWVDALSWSMTRDVLLEPDIGIAWILRASGCILLVAAVALQQPVWTAIAAGVLLMTMAFAGHASMQQGIAGWFHRSNDAIHLLAAGAWLGSLVPLLLVLRRIDQPSWQDGASKALKRFSLAGHLVVAIILASGIADTLLTLGHAPVDLSSPYQLLLVAKIALVAVMLLLALFNRYVFVPRLRQADPAALGAVYAGTLTEISLGLAVLAFVSVFGMLDPV